MEAQAKHMNGEPNKGPAPVLVHVAPHNFDKALEMGAEKYLRDACERSKGEFTFEDLRDRVMSLDTGMFAVLRGEVVQCVVLANVILCPEGGRKIFHIYILAGDHRKSWLDLCNPLYEYAKSRGCDTIRAVARPGWYEDLRALGWRKTHIQMEKRLDDVGRTEGQDDAVKHKHATH